MTTKSTSRPSHHKQAPLVIDTFRLHPFLSPEDPDLDCRYNDQEYAKNAEGHLAFGSRHAANVNAPCR